MTNKEKAQAYDEALKRAKATIDVAADKDLVGGVVRTVFPELAESEDERIIRLLRELGSLDAAKELYEEFNLSYTDVLYWLEKQKEQKEETLRDFIDNFPYSDEQKEQKPAEWSEFDKGVLKDAICATDILGNDADFNKGNPCLAKAFRVAKDWLKSLPQRFNLQPKVEWSEENYDKISKQVYEAIRRVLASLAAYAENEALLDSKEEILSYYSQQCAEKILKSLRPSWKPSEEQMKWLRDVIETVPMTCRQQIPLESLYNDLKKLK